MNQVLDSYAQPRHLRVPDAPVLHRALLLQARVSTRSHWTQRGELLNMNIVFEV